MKKQNWRLIKLIETRGAMQMSIDEAILTLRQQNKVPNTLRFYTWNPPAVTIGFFQNLHEEVNVEKVKQLNYDIVRRYTGGGAVFHDKELTYSLIISEEDVSQDILGSYEKICSGLIKGLKYLNINCDFKPINDIITYNKKISGNAQTRKEGIILQHGTILMDLNVEKMFSLLKVPEDKIKDKMIKSVKERVTSIKQETGKEIKINQVMIALIKGLAEVFNVNIIEDELLPEEIKLAEKLYKEKYSNKNWTDLR